MKASRARRVCRVAVACACACNLVVTTSAVLAADPAAPPAAAPAGEADQLFQQGVDARKAGKLAEAEALFEKAWAMKKTWDIAANLGLVEFNLGKLPEGAEHVHYAMVNLPPTESDETRANLTKAFAAARDQIGGVDVLCDVDGAEVRIAGKLKGTTPLRMTQFVAPGQVTIEVRKDGYVPASKTVEVKGGGSMQIELVLTKQTEATAGPRKELLIGGGAAALVLAGVGVGLLVAASDKGGAALKVSDAIHDGGRSCVAGAANFDSRCDSVKNESSAADIMNRAGIGLLIGGGAIAAGTAAYWLLAPRGSAKDSASVVPIVATNGASVVVRGSF